ncbi:MAG TPA: hypothetical protein VMR62_11800 [Bryobacteraceae bacterium]|jgi:hypothetical protein|nr:hypothetical protein [Bryobacteraceae bacterium]
MAAVLAILKALRRAVGRDLGTLASIKVNNLFLFVVLLSYGALNSGLRPKSAYPFFVLLGFLLLFPLSSDPLGKIPPARLGLWPLSSGQRVGLRFASLALSPVTWIGVLVLIKTAQPLMALAFFSLAAGMQAAVTLGNHAARRDPHWDVLRHIPRFPGRLGGLVRKNVREMLSLLDPYGALLISIGGGAYRVFAAHADPEAFAILGLLVALTMSTYAQSLFGLELGSGSGMTRYRLLPLRGWDVLLAKDIAFLAVLFVLLLPLDPGPGMTFGLAALALGHHSSVLMELPHTRWRFTGGRLLPVGALQAMGGMALGFLEYQRGWAVFALCAAGYLVSLRYYGRCWEFNPNSSPSAKPL